MVDEAYSGGVYSPDNQRIYFVPWQQATQLEWHYVDVSHAGGVVTTAYSPDGVHVVDEAYSGGVYSPQDNRIYLVPYNQASETEWHYIDALSARIVAYPTGDVLGVYGAYQGGVYCPLRNRLYFVPFYQANHPEWHYIECETGTLATYVHQANSSPVIGAFHGGVYSPTQKRIFLIPAFQSSEPVWHYIDCVTGRVVAYEHGSSIKVQRAYKGGVYSPDQNRIYMVPQRQALEPEWHYIDCETDRVVAYRHLVIPVYGFFHGGAYVPSFKRVVFLVYHDGHYRVVNIDCAHKSSKSVLVCKSDFYHKPHRLTGEWYGR